MSDPPTRRFPPRPAWLRTAALAGLALAAGTGCLERARLPEGADFGPDPQLVAPAPRWIPTVEVAEAVGWPDGAHPTPAPDLAVTRFADRLDHPRWLQVLPNGDVLVAESNRPAKPPGTGGGGVRAWVMDKLQARAGARTPSADRITLLRDQDGDGVAETRSVFLDRLHSPFGMALVGNDFYVANTDAVVRYDYRPGATRIEGAGTRLVELPAGPRNHHWTKSLIASPDGRTLYATVGSNSNAGEHGLAEEQGRAAIWAIDRQSGAHRIFAAGLRNPNGMAWALPGPTLWTVVNERDEIGSDLVPDYLTSVVDGGFYGWPYSYFGSHVDRRVAPPRPDLVARALKPDYALGAHTASLGLAYAAGDHGGADPAIRGALPAPFRAGMFVGQHGSWNRRPLAGYKVIFIPFEDGRPSGRPRDVLTGFVDADGNARGRPVGVAFDRAGALLVADDVGNAVWRVSAR
ncbi:MAG: sorbosone dehydrogenase family protein [Lautropia sp.]